MYICTKYKSKSKHMIVSNMTIDEIYREIDKNLSFIAGKIDNLKRKLLRLTIKSKKPESIFLFTKDKNNNEWFIYLNVTKKYIRISKGVLYLDVNNKFNIIDISSTGNLTNFTSHFIERYNERFLHQEKLTKREIFKLFILNNPAKIIKIDENACVMTDGVGLGELHRRVGYYYFNCKTFVNNNMLFENQDNYKNEGKKYMEEKLKKIIKSKAKLDEILYNNEKVI